MGGAACFRRCTSSMKGCAGILTRCSFPSSCCEPVWSEKKKKEDQEGDVWEAIFINKLGERCVSVPSLSFIDEEISFFPNRTARNPLIRLTEVSFFVVDVFVRRLLRWFWPAAWLRVINVTPVFSWRFLYMGLYISFSFFTFFLLFFLSWYAFRWADLVVSVRVCERSQWWRTW